MNKDFFDLLKKDIILEIPTPIEEHGGLFFKRDDYFKILSTDEVNGSKLRQATILLTNHLINNPNCEGVISYCGSNSPQGAIIATLCNHLGLRFRLVAGSSRINNYPMLLLAKSKGAEIILAKSGRHAVLRKMAHDLKGLNDYVIDYGMLNNEEIDLLIKTMAKQVINIPNNIDNIVVTTGSGLTALSVILGLYNYHPPKVFNLFLVGVAPNRSERIEKILLIYYGLVRNRDYFFHYVDLFNTAGFSYDKPEQNICEDVPLHPHYEAKVYKWLVNNKNHFFDNNTLFWVVGSMPEQKTKPKGL